MHITMANKYIETESVDGRLLVPHRKIESIGEFQKAAVIVMDSGEKHILLCTFDEFVKVFYGT